jgi:hypothetical protein
MNRKLYPLIAITAFSSLHANTAYEIKDMKARIAALEENRGNSTAFPPSARPEASDGIGLFFTLEPLYWTATQPGMTYAIKGTNESQSGIAIDLKDGKSKKPTQDWTWGFRLGFGYDLPHDHWDLSAAWTRLRFNEHDKASISQSDPQQSPGQYLSPFWIAKLFPVNMPGLVNSVKAHWKINLDIIDLELGKEFFISRWLTLRPFLGARVAWINQDYNLRFTRSPSLMAPTYPATNSSIWHLDMDNDFWGIGVRAGLNTKWLLGKGWSVYGNAAVSILDGFFHTRFEQTADGSGSTGVPNSSVTTHDRFKNKNNQHADVVITDLALGLRWETVYNKHKDLFALWFGYEQHIFFNQNQFMNYQYDFTVLSRPIEGPNFFTNGANLTTHGIVMGAEFGF